MAEHRREITGSGRQDGAQKMKIREIHKPSSFEGAVWSVQGITDARIIYHAPPGCYMMQHMGALCNEWQPDFYSTLVSYANVMMGTEDALEKVLARVREENPPAIIIVTSPVIEITGDDVEGVAKKAGCSGAIIVRPKLGASLAEGKEQGLLSLLDLMKPPAATDEKTVNLIGPTCNTFNWRADVFELRRMLAGAGIRVNAVLTAGSTVAEIERAPRAALNVCMYPYDCGVETARQMLERFGVPYVADHVPVGFRESAAWLADIAERLAVDPNPFLRNEIRSAFDFSSSLLVSNTLFESSAALCTDNCDTYTVGIASFLHREMGMDICMATAGTDRAGRQLDGVCPTVLVNPGTDEKKRLFLEKAPTIILGNYYDLKLSTDLGFKNFLYADIPLIGYIFSENHPFMGFLGAKNLVETIGNEIYTKIFIETKGEMEGAISAGEVPWEVDAERALGKIAELLPHFVRSIAIKKIHQSADDIALKNNSKVTLQILQEVTEKYTPTRFKARYATLFDGMQPGPDGQAAPDAPAFTMPWDPEAREMLDLVPEEFRAQAAAGTEQFARDNSNTAVSTEIVEAYRKTLGF